MNEPLVIALLWVFDVAGLGFLLSRPDGREALRKLVDPGPVTYWPPRAVLAQFKSDTRAIRRSDDPS